MAISSDAKRTNQEIFHFFNGCHHDSRLLYFVGNNRAVYNHERIGTYLNSDYTYQVIYESKPAIAYEQLIVCRFTLDEPKRIDGSVYFDSIISNSIRDPINDTYNLKLETVDKSANYPKLYKEFAKLKDSKETSYLFHSIANNISYELYIYNQDMNIGY